MLKKNPAVGAVVVIALLAVAALLVMRQSGGAQTLGSDRAFFYDLTTGELKVAASAPPPITLGGNEAVLAAVVNCGSCDPASNQIAYLKTHTDEAAALITQTPPQDPDEAMVYAQRVAAGVLVARPPANPGDEIDWHVEVTDAGQQVLQAVTDLCPGGQATICRP